MFEIRRFRGDAAGRNSGSAAGGFAWAVATADEPLPDMYSQTTAALAKIDRILAGLGTDKTRLVNATVYVTDIGMKAEMDRAWCEWIGDDPAHWPQRACVEAHLFDFHMVEIVVIATAPQT